MKHRYWFFVFCAFQLTAILRLADEPTVGEGFYNTFLILANAAILAYTYSRAFPIQPKSLDN